MTNTEILDLATRHGQGGNIAVIRMMVVAAEVERERCAKIAENDKRTFGAADRIAAAIRNQ